MRQFDRYNPPWERYTRTNYIHTDEIVKRKKIIIALLASWFFTKSSVFTAIDLCERLLYLFKVASSASLVIN